MKHFIITIVLAIGMSATSFSQDDTIIYFGDPMCSWCYGFSNEVSEIKNAFPEVDFQMIMGGLRPYGTQTMGELKDFLKEHWEEIGHLTGQPFSYDILSDPTFIYDTEPACRAVVAVRELQPTSELAFFKAVQKMFYNENKDPKLLISYQDVLKEFNIDAEAFEEKWTSTEFKEKTKADFQLSQQMGVRGFPSMVLKVGDQFQLISNGYQKSAIIIAKIQNVLN